MICRNLIWCGFSQKGFPEGKLGEQQSRLSTRSNVTDLSTCSNNVNLYTAQYSYSGGDRLDITVKGKDPIGSCPFLGNGHEIKGEEDILVGVQKDVPAINERFLPAEEKKDGMNF